MKKVQVKAKKEDATIIPRSEYFGGYDIKNVKKFKGHGSETLFQCSVYKDSSKIGFFSEDAWVGYVNYDFKPKDEKAILKIAKKIYGKLAPIELFINDLVATKNKKKTWIKVKDNLLSINVPWKGNEESIKKALKKKNIKNAIIFI